MTELSTHQLHEPIVEYLHKSMAHFPPSHAPGLVMSTELPFRVGEHLVNLGYLLPHEVISTLTIWRQKAASLKLPLGSLLVSTKGIAIPVLSSVLLLQILERLEHDPPLEPRFLGEQLLVDGYLSPAQLGQVLEEQIRAHQHGQMIRIGNLIEEHGWLDQSTLSREVQQLFKTQRDFPEE